MMTRLKSLGFLVALLLLVTAVQAQTTNPQDTLMRTSGRIYVVVAVMLTILTGIVIYLIRLDRKIGKLEKHQS
jgi:uncharacterized integral membrane protein